MQEIGTKIFSVRPEIKSPESLSRDLYFATNLIVGILIIQDVVDQINYIKCC